MLTKKSVDIFDTERIKAGHFITYVEIFKDWGVNDDGEEDQVYCETQPSNGIIKEVDEHVLTVVSVHNSITRIEVCDLISNSKDEEPKYRILGIKPDAT